MLSNRSEASASTEILSALSLSKTFGGRTVLKDVSLQIQRGEVRGLVGQNGSGKSTLIKIITGIHSPDLGASVRIRGENVELPLTSESSRNLGIACVHQDLGLVATASVTENIRLGRYETRLGGRISWDAERKRAQASLKRFGLGHISPDALVSELLDVERAIVAIIRAVEQVSDHTSGLLILDEPTVYLPKDCVDLLFSAVRQVSELGHGVLFVSHNLAEVLEITDSITVLRDGTVVQELKSRDLTEDALVTAILGFSLGELYPAPAILSDSKNILVGENISGGELRPFSFTLQKGEILGVTGLAGMGHEQLPYLLFGATPGRGQVDIDGVSIDLSVATPREAISAGFALLPANRALQGGAGTASACENATLATIRYDYSNGILRRGAERKRAWRMMTEFRAVPRDPDQLFGSFSGGNQQKILVAKWFETKPKVFIVHEPTQGVDIGSRKEIFYAFRRAADEGTSFIMASNEYEDLAHLCDRVIVFKYGISTETLSGSDLTADRLVDRCLRAA